MRIEPQRCGETAAAVAFTAIAQETSSSAVQTGCETQIAGIPAILLETADLADPIEVGKEVVYEIKVVNQGSAPGTNLKVTCTLPDSEEFASGTGPSPVQAQDRAVTTDSLPVLKPKAQAAWGVTVKALTADDARSKCSSPATSSNSPFRRTRPRSCTERTSQSDAGCGARAVCRPRQLVGLCCNKLL